MFRHSNKNIQKNIRKISQNDNMLCVTNSNVAKKVLIAKPQGQILKAFFATTESI